MSIQDQSAFMQYTARSVCKTGTASISQMSGGTMGVEEQNKIEQHILKRLNESTWSTSGIVPEPLYKEVAIMMLPYTPGMRIQGIIKILKANNLFGLAEPIGIQSTFKTGELEGKTYVVDTTAPGGRRSIVTEKVDPPLSDYEVSRRYAQEKVAKVQSNQMTGGLYSDVQQEVNNNTRTRLSSLTREFRDLSGKPTQISQDLATSVNAITNRASGVLYSSLPNGVQRVFHSAIASGKFPTITSGKTFSIGGGSIDLVNGRVDFGIGNFSVDLSKTTDKEAAKVAAEAVVAETGAVDADVEALAGEVQKVMENGGTLADNFPQEAVDIGGAPIEMNPSEISPIGNNVASVEELEFEMSSATRDISEIIVHWSETYTNANLSVSQVPGGSGYHYIINRDGSINRGTPLNSTGSHCPINNHDAYSIGVCLVGGINVASGDDGIENTGAGSITRTQFNSLYQIFRTFYNQYPGGQALGHMDVDITQEDPGFDVRDYAYNNFNKTSLYTDPLSDAALSPQEIIKKTVDAEGIKLAGITKDPDLMDKKF